MNIKTYFFTALMVGLSTVLLFWANTLWAMDMAETKQIRGRIVSVQFAGWTYNRQSPITLIIRSGSQKYTVHASADTNYTGTQIPGAGDRVSVLLLADQGAWKALKLSVITVGP